MEDIKKYIISNDLKTSLIHKDVHSANYNFLYSDTGKAITDFTEIETEKILEKAFKDYYYYHVFFMEKKKKEIIAFLLNYIEQFMSLKNYKKLLIIIFSNIVTIRKFRNESIALDEYLNTSYNDCESQTGFEFHYYMQFSAVLHRYCNQNSIAKKQIEYLLKNTNPSDTNLVVMNYYIASLVYTTDGEFDQAMEFCYKAKKLLLENNNYVRYLYNQMTFAKVLSSLGNYKTAKDVYTKCLEGARALNDKVQTNILEYLSTVIMYMKDYSAVITTLDEIDREKISNNAAYLYAYSYLQLGNKEKCKEWIENGKKAIFFHQSAANYLILIDKLLNQNCNEIIDYLKEFQKSEKSTEFYGSYKFVTKLLIKYLIKTESYKEACYYANELLDFS